MAEFNGLFVPVGVDTESVSAIIKALDKNPDGSRLAEIYRKDGHPYYLIESSSLELAEIAGELSKLVRSEMFIINAQTVSMAYEIHWFRDGLEVRTLCYSEDWYDVRGEKLPWEDEFFFTREAYDELAEDESDEKVRELQATWAEKRIKQGSPFPLLDIHAFARHFNLPGFDNTSEHEEYWRQSIHVIADKKAATPAEEAVDPQTTEKNVGILNRVTFMLAVRKVLFRSLMIAFWVFLTIGYMSKSRAAYTACAVLLIAAFVVKYLVRLLLPKE